MLIFLVVPADTQRRTKEKQYKPAHAKRAEIRDSSPLRKKPTDAHDPFLIIEPFIVDLDSY